jgi:hypothetical protein
MTFSGNKPATFQLLALCLYQLRYHVPNCMHINLNNLSYFVITSLQSFNRLSQRKAVSASLESYEVEQVDDELWRFATSIASDVDNLYTEFYSEVTLDTLHK